MFCCFSGEPLVYPVAECLLNSFSNRMQRCFVIQTLFLWLVTHGQSMDFEDESFRLTENGASSPTDFKPCPRVPQCDCWTHGVLTKDKTIVRCAKRNLTEVPTQLPNTTVDLDLKDNLIQSLGQNRFSNYPELKNWTFLPIS